MSAVYCVLVALTVVVMRVSSEAGTVINVYSSESQHPVDRNKAGKSESTKAVIFSVGRKSNFAPSSTSRIPMDYEFYNKRGYFNMNTSIFTAPVSGVYAFYFGACGHQGKEIYLFLYAGNPEKAVASTYNYNTASHGQASGSVIIEMKRGDMASLWLDTGKAIFRQPNPSTHFNGFLVTAIDDEDKTTKQC